MNNCQNLGDRIRLKRGKLSQGALAKRVGVSQAFLSEVERNLKGVSMDVLKAIAQALNTSSDYLMGRTNDPSPPSDIVSIEVTGYALNPNESVANQLKREPGVSSVAMRIINIPIISNVKACCGNGNIYPTEVNWEADSSFPVPEFEIAGYTWQTKDFKCIRAEGHSMEPYISDGEIVLFAHGLELSNGDIAVLLWEDRLLIRGVFFGKEKRVELKPANKEYESFVVEEWQNFCVLGKVLKVLSSRKVLPMV